MSRKWRRRQKPTVLGKSWTAPCQDTCAPETKMGQVRLASLTSLYCQPLPGSSCKFIIRVGVALRRNSERATQGTRVWKNGCIAKWVGGEAFSAHGVSRSERQGSETFHRHEWFREKDLHFKHVTASQQEKSRVEYDLGQSWSIALAEAKFQKW